MSAQLDLEQVHQTVVAAFKARDRAYTPYSNFKVGAGILCTDGTIIGGCNIENASYGACICAERTAIPKAVSEGHTSFKALVVVSQVPSPSVSPCGICRQVIREFFPLSCPIIMASSTYPTDSTSAPPSLRSALSAHKLVSDAAGAGQQGDDDWSKVIKIMTLEELLPMSFGPEQLGVQ